MITSVLNVSIQKNRYTGTLIDELVSLDWVFSPFLIHTLVNDMKFGIPVHGFL